MCPAFRIHSSLIVGVMVDKGWQGNFARKALTRGEKEETQRKAATDGENERTNGAKTRQHGRQRGLMLLEARLFSLQSVVVQW